MKRSALAVVAVAVSCWFLGCTTVHDTSALRVGMTKEEAIKAMGQPNSNSVANGQEYLNYIITEPAPGTSMTISRPYYVRLVNDQVQAFGFSDQINRVPVAAGTGNAAARSANLRIGMSKQEAIAVMGHPNSVSADGRYEFLNYTASDTAATGFGTMMRPYTVRLMNGRVEAFGLTEQLPRTASTIATAPTAAGTNAGGDSIAFVRTEPAALTLGKDQELAVRVKYTLRSRQQGAIYLYCNATDPAKSQRVAQMIVAPGSGEVVLKAMVNPGAQRDRTPLRIGVSLYEHPYPTGQVMRPLVYAVPVAMTLVAAN